MSPMSWLPALAIPIALLFDRCFGEPPAAVHPVVGMGRFLGLFGDRLCGMSAKAAFLGGALAWSAGITLSAVIAWAIEHAIIAGLEPWFGGWRLAAAALLLGLALKPMLAWRMLRDEVGAVETALSRSLDEGRARLSRLVSRDTTQLSAREVRETAPFGQKVGEGLAPLLREAARTPSPNGGWPMGAMALRLGRVLSKPGHYRLNPSGGDVIAEDMLTAHRLAAGAMLGLAALLALGAAALRGGFAVVRSTL